jgi:hypothetical protein
LGAGTVRAWQDCTVGSLLLLDTASLYLGVAVAALRHQFVPIKTMEVDR